LFRNDNKVLHFSKPNVSTEFQSNLYIINGKVEEKNIADMLPDIITQIDGKQLMSLKDDFLKAFDSKSKGLKKRTKRKIEVIKQK